MGDGGLVLCNCCAFVCLLWIFLVLFGFLGVYLGDFVGFFGFFVLVFFFFGGILMHFIIPEVIWECLAANRKE